jgi:hypothetical protein
MAKALLGNDSVNTLYASNNRRMSVCLSLLGNKAPMNSPASEAKRSDRCYAMKG